MLKQYLTSFDTEALYNAFKMSEAFIRPNVSLIRQTSEMVFEGVSPTAFRVNGRVYTDKVITLAAGGTYELQGIHEGQIIIDARTVKPSEWTTIRLNNITIISDKAYGILYDCPESDNKGYQGLYVTLEKDSQNFVVCNKENTEQGDETYASIDSWKDLTVQGVGYLAVYNNIGHGLRGETMTVAGPHVYIDTIHDGVHGKKVNILDGVFYVQRAKDAFGTTDNGKINVFGGSFTFVNVTDENFDSKQAGYYAVTGVSGTNMSSIETMYEAGTVTAYPTKADYTVGTNGQVITPVQITTYKDSMYYNANVNGNVVESSTYQGYTVWVEKDQSEVSFSAPLAYPISSEYTFVEVTGKITAPIVRTNEGIAITDPSFSSKGKLNGGYDNKIEVYLNDALIVTDGDAPSIANLPKVGRIKVTAAKNTINAIINKDSTGNGDHDAIKSENNLSIEVKSESILYVTSAMGDGADGGETRFTDSKGAFVATKCGQCGVKGNAIVIGPDAVINSSTISSYITDPNAVDGNGESIYTTFDGIFVAKGNVLNHTVGRGVVTELDPDVKQTGFADVYGRNGKHSKGMFGTTDAELKGVAIIGSIGAVASIDTGNARNLYVNTILEDALHPVTTVNETYTAVPYEGNPIV